ncbi:MAG: hypothetical protein LBQ21_05525 [Clostridiales Family XIII bacterium]|jgi:putative membrane fusion protein|nr:hypothetical protein [Clostridiales Family XIII bacterium]
MKKSTKVLTVIFIVAAIALYVAIYGVPGMQHMLEETTVLEYGDLPVLDEVTVCMIRNETLYVAAEAGTIEYHIDEGTKVRSGMSMLGITGGAPPQPASSESSADGAVDEEKAAIERVLSAAGASAEAVPNNISPITAVVSYFADGYEKVLSPAALETLTKAEVDAIPAESLPLTRTYTEKGWPIYKLTDNNLWYMVYWMNRDTFDASRYAEGESVKVELNSTEINAVIQSFTAQGSDVKVVLRSDMYYSDMPKYRKMDAKVIFAEYQGLIVDEKDVVTRDGMPGVFVKQRNGSFKWAPIQYTKGASAGGKHIVSVGTFTDDAGELVRTVNYYDEILINPAAEGYS